MLTLAVTLPRGRNYHTSGGIIWRLSVGSGNVPPEFKALLYPLLSGLGKATPSLIISLSSSVDWYYIVDPYLVRAIVRVK